MCSPRARHKDHSLQDAERHIQHRRVHTHAGDDGVVSEDLVYGYLRR